MLISTLSRSLRAYCGKAIQLVLGWQAEGRWKERARMSALVLMAACTWLLNGLHSTPDNRPSSRNLMDSILPQIDIRGADTTFFAYGKAIDEDDDEDEDDYDGKTTLPASSYGLTFFHSLQIGPQYPVLRFKAGTALSPRAFHFFFGIEFEDIQENFFWPGHANGPKPIQSHNKNAEICAEG